MDFYQMAPFFHDGSLLAIGHTGSHIFFFLESAEIPPGEWGIPLSGGHRFKGKLHAEGIKRISLNGALFEKELKLFYDTGDIFHLSLQGDCMELQVVWSSAQEEVDFSAIVVEAERIYWEPIDS